MTSKLTPSYGVCLCLGGFLLLVDIDLLIDECSSLVASVTDVCQGFARPGPAGVLFVLPAPPIAIEKLTNTPSLRTEIRPARLPSSLRIRPASSAVSYSSSLMVILAIKWTPPTFPPTKPSALDGRCWTLVEQNTAGAQVNTSLVKSRVKFWKLSRSMKKEMGC